MSCVRNNSPRKSVLVKKRRRRKRKSSNLRVCVMIIAYHMACFFSLGWYNDHMKKQVAVGIVLVNFHANKDTLECLQSLKKLSDKTYKKYVVLVSVEEEKKSVEFEN